MQQLRLLQPHSQWDVWLFVAYMFIKQIFFHFSAAEVLSAQRPLVRCRPLHAATLESRNKAKKCAEFLQPYRYEYFMIVLKESSREWNSNRPKQFIIVCVKS